MRILLTNDDGIFAPGLAALYKELEPLGEITVVAPADVQSGMSHRVTFFEPICYTKVKIEGKFTGYSVEGSPADCVKLGFKKICEHKPDLVISGMNSGANAGINIFYSGTVAAAVEGAFCGVPAIAVSMSMENPPLFEKAAAYCAKVIRNLLPLEAGGVINVNVPRLSMGEPKGIRVVPHSTIAFEESYVEQNGTDGRVGYKLTGGGHRHETINTDTMSLFDGYITVTALRANMTDQAGMNKLKNLSWDI